jgi:hypothetical protein
MIVATSIRISLWVQQNANELWGENVPDRVSG